MDLIEIVMRKSLRRKYMHIYIYVFFFLNDFLITISRANINTNESFYVTRIPGTVVRLRSHSASDAFNYIVASPAIFRVSPRIYACTYARDRVVFFSGTQFLPHFPRVIAYALSRDIPFGYASELSPIVRRENMKFRAGP